MPRSLDDLGLTPNERAALEELRERLRERFADRLVKLTLFGSKARGESNEDSDLDVLVVIRDFDQHTEMRVVDDIGWDVGVMRHGVFVQTVEYSDVEYENCRRREFPLVTNVECEGVPL